MRRFLTLSLVILLALTPLPLASEESIELEINVSAHGNRVALKLDDKSCQFGFPGLVENPELVILGEDGQELYRESMGIGDWSMSNGVAYCDQTYEVSIPTADRYTIQIPPYFTEDYTDKDMEAGSLDIELTRDQSDPFPLPVRPEGGRIGETDVYRIVGTLELLGESGEEFSNFGIVGCTGLGGYKDIEAGAQIKIMDESGDIIAVAELVPDPLSEDADECRFQFIAEVPESKFYSISMGRRGDITYSFDDLEESEWRVELSVG